MIKQTACIAALVFLLSACHKSKTTSCVNKVTLTDGSATYTDCGNPITPFPMQTAAYNFVDVVLQKADTIAYRYESAYNINVTAAIGLFTLQVMNATASSPWTGVYSLHPEDSVFNHLYEGFNGKTYKCSGGTITVSHADSSNVSGTYTMTVFNATETKTISGTFNATHPIVSY